MEWPENKEEQLTRLLASINTETKNVLLAWCLDDTFRGAEELAHRFRTHTESPFTRTTDSLESYINETFEPIGLVARTDLAQAGDNPEVLYTLTEAGKTFARQLAAFAIQYAVDNDISMYSLLGPTGSTGNTRSPMNRFNLLENLSTTASRIEDHACTGNIAEHIKKLQKNKLLIYTSTNGKSIIYTWNPDKQPSDVPTYHSTGGGNRPALTKKIAQELFDKKTTDAQTLANRLNIHTTYTSAILHHLARHDYAHADFTYAKQSKIIITDRGQHIKDYFILPLRYFIELHEGPVVDAWNDFETNAKRKQEYAQRAIELYKKVSPQLNAKTSDARTAAILSALKEGPTRPTDLTKKFSLSHGGLNTYLSKLHKTGAVKKTKKGREVYYSLP